MRTCAAVKLLAKKLMKVDGREWTIPSVTYFVGRKSGQIQTSQKACEAMPMSQVLAEELVSELTLAGLQAEACDVYCDADIVVMETMIDIGEEAPPPVAAPKSLTELSRAIEGCFDQGFSPLEVLNHCNKIVLG